MATTIKASNYNISMRTNDNYILSVELGYDITNAIPILNMKKNNQSTIIGMSEFITKNDANTGFIINIIASKIAEIDAGSFVYDCILDLASGSKIFLFGGTGVVTRGLS